MVKGGITGGRFYFFFSCAQALALALKVALSSSETGAGLTGWDPEPEDFCATGAASVFAVDP